jgi:hypothetical protein
MDVRADEEVSAENLYKLSLSVFGRTYIPAHQDTFVLMAPSTFSQVTDLTPKPGGRPLSNPHAITVAKTVVVLTTVLLSVIFVAQPEETLLANLPEEVDAEPPGDNNPKPGDNTTMPGDNSTDPGDNSTDPGDNSTNPGDNSTDPGDSSTDPGDNSTDPGDNSTDPGDNSTDPGDNSTDPGDNSTDPGDNSTDPGDNSTDPGDNSTDPGDNSTDPGDNSTDPGDNSTDPGDNSTEPNPFWPSKGKVLVHGIGSFKFDPNKVVTVRPDIFRENHFSLFDILVHLDERGDITMEYHFDESMNTHVIDSINGQKNWWYMAYYHGGWPETNAFRMDHYPYKDKMVIEIQKDEPNRIKQVFREWREEVARLEENGGKVIIPRVTILGRAETLTFRDVEVTAHNLRNDTFQDGVITAIDVILSLYDQGKIRSYKLTWYEQIGFSEIFNYWVDGINDDIAYGTCGFVYEEGSESIRWGNHIHIPSDYRVLNSPEYELWFWICL